MADPLNKDDRIKKAFSEGSAFFIAFDKILISVYILVNFLVEVYLRS